MMNLNQHWNEAYQKTEVEKLGWYEEDPIPSLELIDDLRLPKNARILNVGTGASTLIDELLRLGYENLIANDISDVGLKKLQDRLGANRQKVDWIVDDLLNSKTLVNINPVDLWHDRAVLHFFTEPEQRLTYFNLLRKLVKPGGCVIIAAFGMEGAEKCSGLPVYRYSKEMLQKELGEEFSIQVFFDYLYLQPSGNERKYLYTSFIRQIVK
jgi:SAM-dependent methyltransferase